MSGRPDIEVLDYLREQFARVHVKLDRLVEDSRLDRMDARIERIERRLDLVDAPGGNAA